MPAKKKDRATAPGGERKSDKVSPGPTRRCHYDRTLANETGCSNRLSEGQVEAGKQMTPHGGHRCLQISRALEIDSGCDLLKEAEDSSHARTVSRPIPSGPIELCLRPP
jgi:hypothetical protein